MRVANTLMQASHRLEFHWKSVVWCHVVHSMHVDFCHAQPPSTIKATEAYYMSRPTDVCVWVLYTMQWQATTFCTPTPSSSLSRIRTNSKQWHTVAVGDINQKFRCIRIEDGGWRSPWNGKHIAKIIPIISYYHGLCRQRASHDKHTRNEKKEHREVRADGGSHRNRVHNIPFSSQRNDADIWTWHQLCCSCNNSKSNSDSDTMRYTTREHCHCRRHRPGTTNEYYVILFGVEQVCWLHSTST